MAIDSRDKRFAMMTLGTDGEMPWGGPRATWDETDRLESLGLYWQLLILAAWRMAFVAHMPQSAVDVRMPESTLDMELPLGSVDWNLR